MLLFTVVLHLQSCIPPYSLRGERKGWRVCLKHVHHLANPCPANPPLQVGDQPIRTSPSTNISSACWLTHHCTSLVMTLAVTGELLAARRCLAVAACRDKAPLLIAASCFGLACIA